MRAFFTVHIVVIYFEDYFPPQGEALFDFEEITSADIFGDNDEDSVIGETRLESSELEETESLLGEEESLLKGETSVALLSKDETTAEGKGELWFEAQCQDIEEQDI